VTSDVAWLSALGIVLVAMSAFLTATEVALFSLRRVDREQMARSGKRRDAIILGLLEKPRRLIATVLVANDTVNAALAVTALAAIERATIARSLWECVGIAVAIVLPLVVLVGEVLPRLAAQKSPQAWARAAARPLWLLWYLVAPVRWIVHGTADILLVPFGDLGRSRSTDLSEEEFKTLVDAGSAQGQVDQRERRLIHRVFEFGDKTVGQIMTPRDKVFALSYDLPNARLVREVAGRGFSRVPIYTKSLDNVRGILNAKDLVLSATGQTPAGGTRSLGEVLHEPLFVPRTTAVKRLFRIFKQKKVHMALVVNEYGKLLGVVTMDDVLEQLFGDIRDEREGLQSAVRRPRPQPGYMKTPVPMLESGPVAKVEAEPEQGATIERGEDHHLAGAGDPDDPDDGSPVPIADVVTGPSGAVEMPRRDREIDN
jgi:putative hemolysin